MNQPMQQCRTCGAPGVRAKPLVWLIAGGMLVSTTIAAADPGKEQPAATHPAASASPYRPDRTPNSAADYYQAVWGIDNLLVRQTASGNLIRFSYRVKDPARSTALGDKRATPYMIGHRSHAVLQIPVMDKIGQLRQSGTAEAGKDYWMVFSNKGNLVKVGDRVSVVIGTFHADGLTVE